MNNSSEIIHYGTLGMRLGRRRRLNAARSADRDAASLKRAGYKKESESVKKNANKLRKQAKGLTEKIKVQKQKDAKTRKNLKNKDSFKQLAKLGMKDVAVVSVLSAGLSYAIRGNAKLAAQSALRSAAIITVLDASIGTYKIAKTGTPTKPRS